MGEQEPEKVTYELGAVANSSIGEGIPVNNGHCYAQHSALLQQVKVSKYKTTILILFFPLINIPQYTCILMNHILLFKH